MYKLISYYQDQVKERTVLKRFIHKVGFPGETNSSEPTFVEQTKDHVVIIFPAIIHVVIVLPAIILVVIVLPAIIHVVIVLSVIIHVVIELPVIIHVVIVLPAINTW